ncbi:GATOR complex protein DEPDC5 [Araneus ventricosus]|uniref:GATOR complex protein DEPDC5 n=1 Tax=Araneus ventricosus TaxID=182803 RepID=A0A4Y2KDL7_ARAVE|nr:GATOR complex protein DEPDC5 [Araneus ventricosus]
MRTFKLLVHGKNFSEESLVINSKDYPFLAINDIVEITSNEDDCSTLLLQVTSFSNEMLQKGCISIDQSIANKFQLKQYMEVTVKVIDNLKDVSLDSVELTFKDQYLARSDMWRLKNHLINTCLYAEKKLDYFGIRCQVLEMYMQGEKVASGMVTADTKIVYRSASSMVYLFLQMSSEMWDFDVNGDLYFEKAIDGFLPDLFSKWKKLHCNHDVTIVLFSRTFYTADSIEEFPLDMRECLQQDYKGRFFEDFYRVAVQNERYDDWTPTIVLLKKLINQYRDSVIKHHEKPGVKVPKARNSQASQGNFLEVLNMSLNVFEKHYMDRSFDRTGQLSVVITPGVGYFEVDRELTIITKQRIIDNGIGSDLVCLGEQPLHAVPLFKFHNKQLPQSTPSVADDYNMPHWINLSFYSMKSQSIYNDFVPRIKLPTLYPEESDEKETGSSQSKRSRHASQPDPSFPVLFDYDEHDRNVFNVPTHSNTMRQTMSLQRPRKRKDTPPTSYTMNLHQNYSTEEISRLTSSEPVPIFQQSQSHASSAAIAIPHSGQHYSAIPSSYQSSLEAENVPSGQYAREYFESEVSPPSRVVVGSDPSSESTVNKQELTQRLKALVNPFNPSQITIKLTSNRRRWTHVFPLGPTGIFMQQHHYQAIPQISAATLISVDKSFNNYECPFQRSSLFSYDFDGIEHKSSTLSRREIHSSSSNMSSNLGDVRSPNSGCRMSSSLQPSDNMSVQWGISVEQEWTPAITTGVDWKSLVIPACLPITTDYFPDRRSLQIDYVISDYNLLPEDIITENAVPRYFQNDEDAVRHPLTTSEVYRELICQRLQQGFQIIVLSKHSSYPVTQVSSSPQYSSAIFKGTTSIEQEEYLLSIGRIFHRLNLDGPRITVTQYRPRHPHREIKIHYCYRFHAPDSDTYGVSWVDFTSERLENYNWNYLDHYICMRGEGEFELKENLLEKDLICHVSRTKSHSFIYGFYLYYIGSANDQDVKAWDKDELSEKDAIYLFEREWMEVELSPSFSELPTVESYNFPSDEDIWSTPYLSTNKLKFKSCNIQIDQGTKSGRQEWGQLRYMNIYRPYETFELVVEWMVATGNKAAELVQSWARKSNQYGLQLVPIPSDPFALPFSNDSDPLRGPIFIPLDLSCLMETSVQAFDEEGLLKLQEKILCKFGFIPYRNPDASAPPQYVHVSGSMFIMLPVRPKESKKINGKHLAATPLDLHQISSPHDEYITRHFSGVKNKRLSLLNAETDTKIGFLWSWNYMITKRWKNAGTVDENFMRKVMRDFRSFCLNHNSRLEDFWKYSDMSEFAQGHSIMDLES